MEDQKIQATSAGTVNQSLSTKIEEAIKLSRANNRPFGVVAIRVNNIASLGGAANPAPAAALIRDLYAAVRKVIHTSQHVSQAKDGIVIVLEGIETGSIDTINQKLVGLAQHVIRQGRYNDMSARWTDIIHQFLFPNTPLPLTAIAGWAIFPRDGTSSRELLDRAVRHASELHRR